VLESLGLERQAIVELALESDRERRCEGVHAEAQRLEVPEDRQSVFAWLYEWLGDEGRSVDPDTELIGMNLDELPGLLEACERVLESDESLAPALEMIQLAEKGYVEFLRGELDGDRLLFQPGTLDLWERYFSNGHRVTRDVNLTGSLAFERALGGRDEVAVLEIGGGLGSAGEMVIERNASRIGRYLFTDVVPGFLRRGAGHLEDRFPDVDLASGLVDINRSFDVQRLERGSFDVIHAVNVMHLAVDLADSLRRLRDLLRPEGHLVIVEGVRPTLERPIAAEFIFQLMPQFRSVTLDPDTRPRAGFLDVEHWCKALVAGGFDHVDTFPDLARAQAAYPNYYMGAFIAG
jgi:SAM-dependent methyltransferase